MLLVLVICNDKDDLKKEHGAAQCSVEDNIMLRNNNYVMYS